MDLQQLIVLEAHAGFLLYLSILRISMYELNLLPSAHVRRPIARLSTFRPSANTELHRGRRA